MSVVCCMRARCDVRCASPCLLCLHLRLYGESLPVYGFGTVPSPTGGEIPPGALSPRFSVGTSLLTPNISLQPCSDPTPSAPFEGVVSGVVARISEFWGGSFFGRAGGVCCESGRDFTLVGPSTGSSSSSSISTAVSDTKRMQATPRTLAVDVRVLPEAVLHVLELVDALDTLGLLVRVDET